MLCMDNASMHVEKGFFSPTTRSCTELTRCYCLLELLVIEELIWWTPILVGRPWVRDSVRYSLIHLEDSNSLLMHSDSTYVNYCNTGYYHDEYTVNSWAILVCFLCNLFCLVCMFILHSIAATLSKLSAWIYKWNSNSNRSHING